MAKKDIKRNPAAEKIADLILSNYDVQNAKDVNEALKDVFGPIFEKMLNLNSALAALWNLRGVGNAKHPDVEQKLMDNIFSSFSYGLWCISHNEQLCANRREIIKDLKEKIPPREFLFSANVKQIMVSLFTE